MFILLRNNPLVRVEWLVSGQLEQPAHINVMHHAWNLYIMRPSWKVGRVNKLLTHWTERCRHTFESGGWLSWVQGHGQVNSWPDHWVAADVITVHIGDGRGDESQCNAREEWWKSEGCSLIISLIPRLTYLLYRSTSRQRRRDVSWLLRLVRASHLFSREFIRRWISFAFLSHPRYSYGPKVASIACQSDEAVAIGASIYSSVLAERSMFHLSLGTYFDNSLICMYLHLNSQWHHDFVHGSIS